MTREEHKKLIGTLLTENVTQADIMNVVTQLDADYEEMHTTLNTTAEQVNFYKEESAKYSKNCNELYQRMGIMGNSSNDTTEEQTNEPPQKLTIEGLFDE